MLSARRDAGSINMDFFTIAIADVNQYYVKYCSAQAWNS